MGDISKHFSRWEFACSDQCGFDSVNEFLLALAENVRTHFDKPMTVNCVNRCKTRNRSIGSKDTSQHVKGKAMDFKINGVSINDIYDYVNKVLVGTGGLGIYSTFIHMDTRKKKARWQGH